MPKQVYDVGVFLSTEPAGAILFRYEVVEFVGSPPAQADGVGEPGSVFWWAFVEAGFECVGVDFRLAVVEKCAVVAGGFVSCSGGISFDKRVEVVPWFIEYAYWCFVVGV